MTVPNETAARPAAVYRLFNEADELLYIGSAFDPDHRCKDHRKKSWWPEVARRTDEWVSDRATAYREELKAIAAEDPKHNVMGSRFARYTEPMRRREEGSRERGRVQSEAWKVWRTAWDESRAAGASFRETSAAAEEARFAFIEASGLFPAWIERRKRAQAS